MPTEFMTLESLGGGDVPDLLISQLEIRRDTIEQALETAHREGVEVLTNPSPALYLLPHLYSMVSHLVMNETEAWLLSECTPEDIKNQTGWAQIVEYFHKLGVKNVVITLGEKGAYYSNDLGAGYVEAEKNCTVLDTSGAGSVTPCLYSLQFPSSEFSFHIVDTNTRAITGTVSWVDMQQTTWHKSNRANGTSKLRCISGAKHQHV